MPRIEEGRGNVKTPIGKVASVVRGRESWKGGCWNHEELKEEMPEGRCREWGEEHQSSVGLWHRVGHALCLPSPPGWLPLPARGTERVFLSIC